MTTELQEMWRSTEEPEGTVYVVLAAEWKSGDVSGTLLLDTGEPMWGHLSSSRGWLWRDLTQSFNDRRRTLAERYPNGYKVLFVDVNDQLPQEVLDANKAWAEANPDKVEKAEASGT